MPDELEWRPSSVAFFADGPLPVHDPARPAALPAAAAARAAADGARGRRACSAADRDVAPLECDDRPRLDRARRWAARPWEQGLGPAAARQVRRPRRRHLDGVAVEQADPAPPDQGRARRARSCSATRAAASSRSSTRCSERIEARGGRVLIDRPAARLVAQRRALRRRRRRAGLVPARPRPARLRARRRAERYDAVVATVPTDVFEQLLDAGAARRVGDDYLGRLRLDRVPRRALPAARARPPVHALLLDQRGRPRPAVRRADRADQPDRARALRRAPLPLRGQLPAAGHALLALDADELLDRLRARPAQGQPGVRPRRGSGSAGCSASPPRSRS